MPEGPEVKKMSTKVNNMVSNLKLVNVKINNGRYLKKLPTNYEKFKSSLPLTVKNVNCHGKFMWWEFKDKNNEDSDITLFNTLGMTGYWTKEDDLKHNNVSFIFQDNYNVHFNDYRNFGTIILCDKENLAKKLKTLGPDLLAIDKNLKNKEHQMLGVELFKKRLERKRKDTMIASALLDQKVASGCGNYIRADILYLAKVDPFKEIGKLSNSEIELIWYLMRQIAFNNWNKNLGLKYGVVDKKFKFAEDYNRHFFVYMQENDINGKLVYREKLNGRTIHYVK